MQISCIRMERAFIPTVVGYASGGSASFDWTLLFLLRGGEAGTDESPMIPVGTVILASGSKQ